jgi:hypothetical protein
MAQHHLPAERQILFWQIATEPTPAAGRDDERADGCHPQSLSLNLSMLRREKKTNSVCLSLGQMYLLLKSWAFFWIP